MKRPATLTARFVETVNKPGRYGDGRGGFGLSLLVKPMSSTGRLSKSWSQRIRVNGRETNIGIGSYPVTTLAEARAAALANKRAIAQGVDPRTGGIPTFAAAVDKVLDMHRETWRDSGKSEAQWRSSLTAYAFPTIGDKLVSEITTADVLAIVTPIWSAKRETARRIRQRVGAVMKWAIAEGHRADNPAGEAIGSALPKNGNHRKHHRALPHREVAGALDTVRRSQAWPATKLALEFVVLTAARSGEVRGARWAEMDLEAATWTVPGERMKAGRDHRVPLSARAVAILSEARSLSDGAAGSLVFPAQRGGALSDATLGKLMKDRGIAAVPHGFRSSFRDWCGETGVAREVAEAALAHVLKDKAEAAYARSDLLDRRREVMADWSEYVSG